MEIAIWYHLDFKNFQQEPFQQQINSIDPPTTCKCQKLIQQMNSSYQKLIKNVLGFQIKNTIQLRVWPHQIRSKKLRQLQNFLNQQTQLLIKYQNLGDLIKKCSRKQLHKINYNRLYQRSIQLIGSTSKARKVYIQALNFPYLKPRKADLQNLSNQIIALINNAKIYQINKFNVQKKKLNEIKQIIQQISIQDQKLKYKYSRLIQFLQQKKFQEYLNVITQLVRKYEQSLQIVLKLLKEKEKTLQSEIQKQIMTSNLRT